MASRSRVNAVCQPCGTGAVVVTGSGSGMSGSTASTATAAGSQLSQPGPARSRTVARAWSRPNASRAAAAPSASRANRLGSISLSTGRCTSQCQGSQARGPPRERISSTANVTAVTRTWGTRQ